MEDEESLEAGAHVRQLPHPVKHQVDDLLADGVVASRVVVGRVLLAGDQLLGVEQLPVGAGADLSKKTFPLKREFGPHLVHDGWFKVNEDSSGNMLASSRLREERVEGVVPGPDGLKRES